LYRDYSLGKKAGYYFVKRAFATGILTFRDWAEKQSVQVWAVNDLGRDVKGGYTLSSSPLKGRYSGKVRGNWRYCNSAIQCDQVGETVTGNHDRGISFFMLEFSVPGKEKIESFHLFKFDREISYPKCQIRAILDRISSRNTYLHWKPIITQGGLH